MDNVTLKKKLSSYISDKGYLKNVSDDVLFELLVAWEHWTGSSKEFYASLGFTHTQMASLIGKAKKMKREGYFGEGDFKKINVLQSEQTLATNAQISTLNSSMCSAAEIVLSDGKLIRFSQIDYLLDYLKKVA